MKKILTILGLAAATLAGANAQTVLSVGDLTIIGFNSNAPDNLAFVSWVDLASNTAIKFTDNGFLSSNSSTSSSNARGGENFVIWKNNTGASIAAGTVITIEGVVTSTGNASAGSASGLNGISSSGDQLFAYQGSGTGANPDFSANTNPATFSGTLLFGLNFAAAWLSTGTPSSNTSYLPSDLNVSNGNLAISTASTTRGQYTGSHTFATAALAKAAVNDLANWTTATSTGTITLDTTIFAVPEPKTWAMIGLGTFFMIWNLRRKRRFDA